MKSLPAEIIQLEENGNWADLRHRLATMERNTLTEAALARTSAFLGDYDMLDKVPDLSGSWIQAYWFLAEAKLWRQKQNWEMASKAAKLARKAALLGAPIHLVGEAIFAQAIAFVELGHRYRGLELFASIRRCADYSSFRRNLALLNEAWLLYDLGQVHALKSVVGHIPATSRMRVEVMLAVLAQERDAVHDLAAQEKIYLSQIESEKIGILGLFVEWAAVNGPLKFAWIDRELERLRGAPGTWNYALYQLWQGENVPIPEGSLTDWRDELDICFAAFLSCLSRAPQEALSILRNRIEPLLELHRIRPGLMADLCEVESVATCPWTATLRERLGFSTGVRTGVLQVDRVTQTVYWNGNSLCLKKSPVAYRCLVVLSGPRGSRIKKSDLHRELTGNRYAPHLHDSRLHKILGRLSQRLQSELGCEAFSLPGDNTVALLESIRLV